MIECQYFFQGVKQISNICIISLKAYKEKTKTLNPLMG